MIEWTEHFRDLPTVMLSLDERRWLLCGLLGQTYEIIDWEQVAAATSIPYTSPQYWDRRQVNLGRLYEHWAQLCDAHGIASWTHELDWNQLDYLSRRPLSNGVCKNDNVVLVGPQGGSTPGAHYSITGVSNDEPRGVLLGFVNNAQLSQLYPYNSWTSQQWAFHQAYKALAQEEYKPYRILDDAMLALAGTPMKASAAVYYSHERGMFTDVGFYPHYGRGVRRDWYEEGKQLYERDTTFSGMVRADEDEEL